MSKDILGSLVRALVDVPNNRLGLLLDHANKLSGKGGDIWEQESTLFLRKELCWSAEKEVAPAPKEEPPLAIIIQVATLPTPQSPNWSRGEILTGVSEPKALDPTRLSSDAWFHPSQTGSKTRPTGHQILASLVDDYKIGEDKAGKTYQVPPTDLINGHFGLRELVWLEQNWKTPPKAFRDWAKGKLLYAWADAVRDDSGYLHVPCLCCYVETPYVYWSYLGNQWYDHEPALREQVSA